MHGCFHRVGRNTKLQVNFRKNPCPEYLAQYSLFCKVCGIHHVKAHRRYMLFAAKTSLLLLVLCIVAGGWLAWSYNQPSVNAQSFQRASWLDGSAVLASVGDPGCVRGAMALDLIHSNRLIGMNSDELTLLLGPSIEKRRGFDWMYPLGQCSGFGWEDSALMIQLGGERKVTSARFRRAP